VRDAEALATIRAISNLPIVAAISCSQMVAIKVERGLPKVEAEVDDERARSHVAHDDRSLGHGSEDHAIISIVSRAGGEAGCAEGQKSGDSQ